jgi:CDP-6-deoxy-D-xylo-4-hexulose-3-dehydrase
MKVRLHEPTFGEEEIQAACEQMRTTHVTMGPKVREFEEQCARYFGVKYAVMCNSGSSANLLALAAITNPAWNRNLKAGDDVIVPALSWATTVWPIIQCGLVPVFVDCDLATYNIDVQKLEDSITSKTKAIMLVHVYGNPCDMDTIRMIALRRGLIIIEDCCEAMGAKYHNKFVGGFGLVNTMSFYFSHHITTFEGGICLTNSYEMADLMRILRAHGWSRESNNPKAYEQEHSNIDPRFLFVNIGYNLRPTEVQAVIGMKQLPKLDRFVHRRRDAQMMLRHALDKYSAFFQFQEETELGHSSWFGFGIVLKDNCKFTVKSITSFLQKKGVETRPVIAGNMARQPALKMFRHEVHGSLENCDRIMRNGFAIGCHQDMGKTAVEYVEQCFDDFMAETSWQ